jgi:hypothetical protein
MARKGRHGGCDGIMSSAGAESGSRGRAAEARWRAYIEEEEMAGRPLNGGEHCGVGAAVR